MDLGPALKKVDLLGPQLFNERSERGNGVVRGQQRVEVSADKIGYISIISCNINILHRMLCE
jgi:hypothetical protein